MSANPPLNRTSERLLAQIESHLLAQIEPALGRVFDTIDDALFDLAERNAAQAQGDYFHGMREIRRKRLPIAQEFLRLVKQSFEDFRLRRLSAPGAGERPRSLSLVDEREMELIVALNSMAGRIEGQHGQALWALNQRFGALIGARELVDNARNPMGPRRLSECFIEATEVLEVSLEVRLIVLKHFEREVLGALEGVIDQVNNALARAGVLPEIRHEIIRKDVPAPRRPEERPSPAPRADAQPSNDGQPIAGDEEETRVRILQVVDELRSLLAQQRRQGGVSGGGAGGAPLRQVRDEDILSALTAMQSELSARLHEEPTPDPALVGRFKDALLRRVGGVDERGRRVAELGKNEDTLDLVGMVFEYAIQDRNLAPPIQAQLARLQIPYLKVALLDPDFLTNAEHPARKLLDRMSEAAIGWSPDADKDQRLLEQIRQTVNAVLRDFEDDLGVFERLGKEFESFLEQSRKRAEVAERRAAEAARGRERLELAQRMATRALRRRLSGRLLPEKVRELLTQRWMNYLAFVFLRHGPDSEEWQAAENFVDQVVAVVQPPKDAGERERLRSMRPALEWTLRKGLAATGMHEQDIDAIWEGLAQIIDHHIEAIESEQAQPAVSVALEDLSVQFGSAQEIPAAGAGEKNEVGGEPEQGEAEGAGDAAQVLDDALRQWMEVTKQLKAGTWFEFLKDDGTRERAKLLWISTIRALYLFVNRNGLKVAEKTARQLAEELHRQRAVILEETALVNRALDAILARLRQRREGAESASAAQSEPRTSVASGA
jgi:hypothetical protein